MLILYYWVSDNSPSIFTCNRCYDALVALLSFCMLGPMLSYAADVELGDH